MVEKICGKVSFQPGMKQRLRFSSDADIVRLTNARIIYYYLMCDGG